MKLAGRCALITGGSLGLGLEIARAFLKEGAQVMVCSREKRLLGGGLVWARADVSKPGELEALFRKTLARFHRLDILVNNAGLFGPKGPLEKNDWRQWTQGLSINLLGAVYACRLAVPHFKKQGYGKIVNLSGGGATGPMPFFSSYAAAKAGVVRFTETLAEELRGTGVDVNAVAPGALNTRFLAEVLKAGPRKVGRDFHERALRQKSEGGASLERAAALAVFLASSESDGITGKLISSVWDPWETLSSRKKELQESDVYTLRRIRPEDRGPRPLSPVVERPRASRRTDWGVA